MNSSRMQSTSGWALPALVTILALADGTLHLMLDVVLFRGNFLGPLPPFPQPFPLPLNQLFVLNAVGFLVLVVLFWLSPRLLGRRRWLIDVALIVYTSLSILGWLYIGLPNPRGLGYLAKAIEVALILALLAHLARTRSATPADLERAGEQQ